MGRVCNSWSLAEGVLRYDLPRFRRSGASYVAMCLVGNHDLDPHLGVLTMADSYFRSTRLQPNPISGRMKAFQTPGQRVFWGPQHTLETHFPV